MNEFYVCFPRECEETIVRVCHKEEERGFRIIPFESKFTNTRGVTIQDTASDETQTLLGSMSARRENEFSFDFADDAINFAVHIIVTITDDVLVIHVEY